MGLQGYLAHKKTHRLIVSTDCLRQVIDIAVTPGAAPLFLFNVPATTSNPFPPGAGGPPSLSSAGPPQPSAPTLQGNLPHKKAPPFRTMHT